MLGRIISMTMRGGWLRTEGVMPDVSMLECVAMWKEADLFKQWFPLCTDSVTLAEQGRVELLAWMQLAAPGVPIGKRDAVLHGFGVDALADGFMMIIGKSAKQSDFPEVVFPPLRGLVGAYARPKVCRSLLRRCRRRRYDAPMSCT